MTNEQMNFVASIVAIAMQATKPPDEQEQRMEQWSETVRRFAADIGNANPSFKPCPFYVYCGMKPSDQA